MSETELNLSAYFADHHEPAPASTDDDDANDAAILRALEMMQ